jgi:hypothetical protein
MYTYVKKLQSKSEESRKQIFIGSMIVCMAFVGFIWVNSLGYRFNKETTAKTQADIKPFALFEQSVSDTVKNMTASLGNVSSLKKDLITKTEEAKKAETEKQIDLTVVEYK